MLLDVVNRQFLIDLNDVSRYRVIITLASEIGRELEFGRFDGGRHNRRGRPCGTRSGVVSFPRQRTYTSHGDERFHEWPSPPVMIDGIPLPRLRDKRKWAFKEANWSNASFKSS